DSTLAVSANSDVPFIYMVYTKENAPEWLYTNGVPKVDERDSSGNITGHAPYYANPTYKFYFKRMIATVRQHVESLPASVRSHAIGVQGCFGSTGDYISYKGSVAPQYDLTSAQFSVLFREFCQYYYDEYKNTNPKIYVLNNPSNTGAGESLWLIQNCPGGWIKTGTLGKGFQLNDEKSKSAWLYSILNSPQNGSYVRSRSEITGGPTSSGWWLKARYKNMFALMCYGVSWGLDMPNESATELSNTYYDSSFGFFNKYAKYAYQKDPLQCTNAMCALKDGLDASDAVRFPAGTFGSVDRNNIQRYQNIVNQYSAFGAKLEDPGAASGLELAEISATGTNDVGWDIFPGNYERYIHQITPNVTSIGYWNVQSIDTNSMYGRFARGFDIANGKDAMYFDVDSVFLNNAPVNGQYPITIDITYLDNGTGSWKLFYDAQSSESKSLANITCTNTGLWKKVSFLITDAYFGNRAINSADFYIKSTNSQNVIFSVVELARPKTDQSDIGLFVSSGSTFDTACINSTPVAKSFKLSGSFLDGSNVVTGPMAGYSFASVAGGPYKDSLIINNYGNSINKTIYVKLSTASLGYYNSNIPIKGGGVSSKVIVMPGSIVNSAPSLSSAITNITCNGVKNGAIDLTTNGGTQPFSYNWTGTGVTNPGNQDINGLSATSYTVTVTSYAGCTTTASYTVTEPNVLIANATGDPMICKNGTTSVYVTATGGTQPYTGTGTFSAPKGSTTYTVTDAKGCVATKSYSVTNGTLVVPGKPGTISGSPDATSLCNGGNFIFSIGAVATATSYTWIPPAGSSIAGTNGSGTQVTLSIPSGVLNDSVTVSANNACGSSTTNVKTLSTIPANTSSITGNTLVAPSQAGLVYSVTAVAGLNYIWTVPAGAVIVSGQNTSSITVNWGILPGTITVKGTNNCSSSSLTSTNVNVINGTFASSPSTLPSFNTLCVNSLSNSGSFTLTGSGLNGTDVVVGPVTGFVFSGTAGGTYGNTFVISNYGLSVNRSVYVKFNPATVGSYATSIPVTGGGGTPISISVTGTAVNSSPVLSAAITNITCNGAKNGIIDLTATNGTGPFSYSWTGTGTYDPAAQDISGLWPVDYTVTVTSYAGCTTSATYTVTQPAVLAVNLTNDVMVCKNTTTNVYVSATGGTLPYTGTGTFSAANGTSSYTVTDAKGCIKTASILVPNGSGVVPDPPVVINGTTADASGLCGGGSFAYSVDTVATATSYTWSAPAGSSIAAPGNGAQITLTAPSNFTTGSLSVTANNICGSSIARVKTLSAIPAPPGIITGPTSITANQTGMIYSVPQVAGVNYTWTVPGSATILGGQNTSSVTVKWGAATGKIKVLA
ncbi:MAG TPA: hypothetical protein PLA68_06155, partial [Panacibacter sp.]|nr:hypothetical protein [Panacibacter sp.]